MSKSIMSSSTLVAASTTALGAIMGMLIFNQYQAKRKQTTSPNSESSQNKDQNGVLITLPDWANKNLEEIYFKKIYRTDEEKMELAIEISRLNSLEHKTGGPFGSAIFYDNKLISIGMNRVVPLNNSTLHGETVAIQLAQSQCRTYSFQQLLDQRELRRAGAEEKTEKGLPVYELFTSCEPCAMCVGAVLWSGLGRMVCGATKDDAMAIGFDEGPVYPQSYKYLEDRGIEVVKGVLQEKAAMILKEYGQKGVIYNR